MAVGLLTVLLTTGLTSVVHAADRPNIVLIVIDDLGYGDLGCYGNAVHQTPHMDQLATEGLRLTDFHTNGPVCSPTRAALLTGRYQQRSGIEYAIGFTRDVGMPLSEHTIAERLARVGYTSGVFGKWHVGHVDQYGPNLQGFDESWCSNNTPDYHTHISRVGELDWYHNHRLDEEPGYLTDLVTQHTCEFIRTHRNEPFFAFVSHLAVHFPYQGPNDPPHRTGGKIWHQTKYGPLPKEQYKRAYRDMLEAVDDSVGQVVATLDRLGLRRNTLILVISDNGAYSWVGSNGPYRGQKGDLFEGGHRVPAIVNWPGRIRPGAVSDQTVMTMDILPTLLAIAGIDAEPGPPLDGIDLSAMLFGGHTLEPRTLCWRFDNSHTQTHAHAVRRGRFKYVVQAGKRYLFDLEQDPSERRNLIDRDAAKAQPLEAAYQQWLAQVENPPNAPGEVSARKQATDRVKAPLATANATLNKPKQTNKRTVMIINKGFSGKNTRDGINLLDQEVLALKPQHVIVYFGMNDAINSHNLLPLESYANNLRIMVKRLREGDVRNVALVTLNPVIEQYVRERHPKHPKKENLQAYLASYDQAIRTVAAENKLPLIDLRKLVGKHGGPAISNQSLIRCEPNGGGRDGVHLTARAYALLGQLAFETIGDRVNDGEAIVCFGDSLTFGVRVKGAGTTTGETYPAALQRCFDRRR